MSFLSKMKKLVNAALAPFDIQVCRRTQLEQPQIQFEQQHATMLREIALNLRDFHQANLYNQIALSNQKAGRVTLYTPWSTTECKNFTLERFGSGELSVTAPSTGGMEARKALHIVTIPKSGTHLISQTLKNLGYSNAIEILPYPCPYPLATSLHSNGTVSFIHIEDICHRKDYFRTVHDGSTFIFGIRDLRFVVVSLCRWMVKLGKLPINGHTTHVFPANSEITSDLLLALFEHIDLKKIIFESLELFLSIMNGASVRMVRFEDMISPEPDIRQEPIAAIAEATGFSLEEVSYALETAYGHKTVTYTGQFSELGDFWTQGVEDRFVAAGGDILNEKLGYSRHYSPKRTS